MMMRQSLAAYLCIYFRIRVYAKEISTYVYNLINIAMHSVILKKMFCIRIAIALPIADQIGRPAARSTINSPTNFRTI